MAFCKNCGSKIDDKAVICPKCGVPQQSLEPDNGGFLWGLLGCLVPVAGLVLYLIWKDTKPKSAKAAGIGALISVGLGIFLFVIYFLILIVIGIGFATIAEEYYDYADVHCLLQLVKYF